MKELWNDFKTLLPKNLDIKDVLLLILTTGLIWLAHSLIELLK